MINKSLDEIDAMVKSLEQDEQDLSKSEVSPEEISNDTPAPSTEEGTEEGEETTEEPTEEGEEPMEDGEVEDDTDEEPTEEFGKSLAEELNEDDDVRKALEVSEFLDALVKGISDRLLAHDDSIAKSLQGADKSNELLAKSFHGIVETQKAVVKSQTTLSKSIADLTRRLDTLEHSPVVRKSVSTTRDQVIEKSFAGNNNTATNNNMTLSKSDAVEKLTIECANKPELVQDVLALESTGDFNVLSALAKSILSK